MQKLVYVAWFRDESLEKDDQDYEWPACFVINSENSKDAVKWGDILSKKYSNKWNQKFIKSYIDEDAKESEFEKLPIVEYGEYATDEFIGW